MVMILEREGVRASSSLTDRGGKKRTPPEAGSCMWDSAEWCEGAYRISSIVVARMSCDDAPTWISYFPGSTMNRSFFSS